MRMHLSCCKFNFDAKLLKKSFIAGALKSKEKLNELSYWQRLMLNIIKCHVFSETSEFTDWAKCNEAINSLSFAKEELLGFSLSMAKEKNIEGAVSGILKLLRQEEVLAGGMSSAICAEFIRFFGQGSLTCDKGTSSDVWINDIRLHINFLNLLSIIIDGGFSVADETTLESVHKIIKKLEEIKISHTKKPDDLSVQAWKILQEISYCNIDSGLPEFVLVESRSLPRSGHHFLKNLLQIATKGQFSYCESYNEHGCCNSNSCEVNSYWSYARKKQENHLRLIKSHDFSLKDKTFNCMPGMYRIIQIREPFDLLVSWLELAQLSHNKELLKEKNIDILRIFLYHAPQLQEEGWEIIDTLGKTMNAEEVKEWLAAKKEYIKSFLAKWVLISNLINSKEPHSCGNFVLHYQDMNDPRDLLNLLKIKGFDPIDLPDFRPARLNVLTRKSILITKLAENNSELIQEISCQIKESTPPLVDGNPVWRNREGNACLNCGL